MTTISAAQIVARCRLAEWLIAHAQNPLDEGEMAMLVALYDSMGSARVTYRQMMDERYWDRIVEPTYESLEKRGLVGAVRCEREMAVDVFLTDDGMVVANEVQQGYDRRRSMKLGGQTGGVHAAIEVPALRADDPAGPRRETGRLLAPPVRREDGADR